MTESKAEYITSCGDIYSEYRHEACGYHLGWKIERNGKMWLLLGDILVDYMRGVCENCHGRITFDQSTYDLARLTRTSVHELEKENK